MFAKDMLVRFPTNFFSGSISMRGSIVPFLFYTDSSQCPFHKKRFNCNFFKTPYTF
jgi:hypothetical protein